MARFGSNATQNGNMHTTKAPELKWKFLNLSWNRGLKFRLFEVCFGFFSTKTEN